MAKCPLRKFSDYIPCYPYESIGQHLECPRTNKGDDGCAWWVPYVEEGTDLGNCVLVLIAR